MIEVASLSPYPNALLDAVDKLFFPRGAGRDNPKAALFLILISSLRDRLAFQGESTNQGQCGGDGCFKDAGDVFVSRWLMFLLQMT